MSDIRQWLEELGLGQYADAFDANDITPELLFAEILRLIDGLRPKPAPT